MCGEGEGLILETPLKMGQTLKADCSSKLDIKLEKKLAAQKLKQLQAQGISEQQIASTMSDFGMKRFLTKHIHKLQVSLISELSNFLKINFKILILKSKVKILKIDFIKKKTDHRYLSFVTIK